MYVKRHELWFLVPGSRFQIRLRTVEGLNGAPGRVVDCAENSDDFRYALSLRGANDAAQDGLELCFFESAWREAHLITVLIKPLALHEKDCSCVMSRALLLVDRSLKCLWSCQ